MKRYATQLGELRISEAVCRQVIQVVCTLVFLLAASTGVAQQISGAIVDATSKAPLLQVSVRNGKESTQTDINGRFKISRSAKADTLLISKEGYQTIQQILTPENSGKELHLELSSTGISLREVQVRAKERYKADSIRMRKEFSKAFQFHGPRIEDLFMARSPENRISLIRDPNSNSIASIVHINLLQLPGFLARKKNPLSKLKKQLLEGEKTNAIDQRFSKTKIAALTRLSGDSLNIFMNTYRPKADELQQQTDYELMLYIKKCYSEFIRRPVSSPAPLTQRQKEP